MARSRNPLGGSCLSCQLTKTLGIPIGRFAYYTYRRISTFLHKHPPPCMMIPENVWNFLFSPTSIHKGISLFYNILQNKPPMLKWEEDPPIHPSLKHNGQQPYVATIQCLFVKLTGNKCRNKSPSGTWHHIHYQKCSSPTLLFVRGDVDN